MKIINKRSDKNINYKKKIIVGIMICINLFVMNVTYARYISIEKITASLHIAKPVFVLEGGEYVKINELDSEGYYEFSIKNFNEINISDVSFLYTIEIVSNIDKLMQFELYNENRLIPLEDLKTQELLISGKEKIEQKYRLKIIYDDLKNISGKTIREDIKIKVYSEQEEV